MKAVVYEGKNNVVLADREMPKVRAGTTLVKVAYAGLCGSDMTIYAGMHPRAKAPLVLGHEISGYTVSENSEIPIGSLVSMYNYIVCNSCDRCLNGQQHVCCNLKVIGIDVDGGMSQYALVPNECLYVMPKEMPAHLAVLTEPVSVAVHCVRKCGYVPGDSVAIFGAGAIGMNTALTFRRFGALDIVLVEPNVKKREIAKKLGFEAIDPSSEDVTKRILQRSGGLGADFVVDCAGQQSVISSLHNAVKINGKIVILAGYPTPPMFSFHQGMFRELTIQFVRNSTRKDFEIASDLLMNVPEYDILSKDIYMIDQAPEMFDRVSKSNEFMKIIFQM